MQIEGVLSFRNNTVYVKDEHGNEINLFVWLATLGLKDKRVNILVEKI